MAREWTLQETRALVEEHILLKQQEGPGIRTASEHWNKVANKMREQGFYRSHRSCNKRWYRLEQYEGKHRNYWDLTRAERLEHRAKWPQLPSGDGIDKEIFSSLTRLLRHFEKDASSEVTHHEPCVEKEMVPTADQLEVGSGNRFVQILPPNFPKPLHPSPDNFNKRNVHKSLIIGRTANVHCISGLPLVIFPFVKQIALCLSGMLPLTYQKKCTSFI